MECDDLKFLYSDAVMAFVRRAKEMVFEIFRNECRFETGRTRFYIGDTTWPVSILVFEGSNRLAYFSSEYLEIGLHKSLIVGAKQVVLRNILRHEIAHYLHWIEGQTYGVKAHGEDFRRICKRYGWGKEVYLATCNVEDENLMVEGDLRTDELIAKVKKLFALANSSNSNEAEIATKKANELIIKYNLSFFEKGDESCRAGIGELVQKRILPYKRRSGKIEAIRQIVETFGVRAIYGLGCLEVVGPSVSVEVAEYVAVFLNRHFEDLYKAAQKRDSQLRGTVAKNSFFSGIGEGYLKKMKETRSGSGSGTSDVCQLSPIDNYHFQLNERVDEWVYPRLSATKSFQQVNRSAKAVGIEAGKALTIAKPLTTEAGKEVRYLSG